MRRARERVIKKAIWEIRYNTRLVFFDRAGLAVQPFLEWDERRFFPRWGHDADGFRLYNPETSTHFSMGPKAARAMTENLRPVEDLGGFRARVMEFFEATIRALEIPSLSRVGQRFRYLVETREPFDRFAQALNRQLTRLADLSDIEACVAKDISVIWISNEDDLTSRWMIGPLQLKEFPAWFESAELPPDGAKEMKRFYPAVSLLIDVDAYNEGEMPAAELGTWAAKASDYADRQVLRLADALSEE